MADQAPQDPNLVGVNKADWALAQQAKNLLDKLWNSPEHGADFKRKLKAVNPELRIPEVDIVDQATKPLNEKFTKTEEQLQALQKRLDEREQRDKDKSEEDALLKDIDSVKKKYSLTEEGVNKVVERMKEKKAFDPEAAAAWVISQQPKAEPARDSKLGLPGKMDMFGSAKKDDAWKDLHDPSDPFKHFDKEVEAIFDKPENYKEFGGQL